jgi:hypothetical protein
LLEVAHEHAFRATRQQPREIGLAEMQWQFPQIVSTAEWPDAGLSKRRH